MACISIKSDDSEAMKQLFERMAKQRIKVQSFLNRNGFTEVVVQNKFTSDLERIVAEIKIEKKHLQYSSLEQVGIIALIGNGLNFNSRIAEKVFKTFKNLKIETKLLQVTELRISWIMSEGEIDRTVKRLHERLKAKVKRYKAYGIGHKV